MLGGWCGGRRLRGRHGLHLLDVQHELDVVRFTTHTTNTNMIGLDMTLKAMVMIANASDMMRSSLGVTVLMTAHGFTKLCMLPTAFVRNTPMSMFGNGSVQFCGSSSDVV